MTLPILGLAIALLGLPFLAILLVALPFGSLSACLVWFLVALLLGIGWKSAEFIEIWEKG